MKRLHILGIILFAALVAVPAHAALTLTAAGIADGFNLSTFATLVPGFTGCCGPLGVGVLTNGNIIVQNIAGTNARFVFSDVDGQTPASALFTVATGGFNNPAFASVASGVYGANAGGGQFVQFNTNGTINHILTGLPNAFLGMWGNPANGHIIATSSVGLIDIDPLGAGGFGTFRVIAAGVSGDGVSISPDGTTAYLAVAGGAINAYSIATGALIHSYPGFNTPDGNGVISSNNSLNGQIIVNNNNGEVDLLNPVTGTFVAIATGGTRGDYVSPDTSNGTLFMDFSDVIIRLSCGPNCSIGGGGGGGSVPEPSSVLLLGTAASLLAWRLRRKKGAA